MAKKGARSLSYIRKKVTLTHETISAAYHEAGHALYTLLCGLKVPCVYVFENKKTKRIEGLCKYEIPNFQLIKDPILLYALVNAEIGIKYAGLTAEKYHFKILSGSDKFPMFLRDGSSDDTTSAAALIRSYRLAKPGKERYAYKKKMINFVLNQLKLYWADIVLIAHALFGYKKIMFDNLKKILTKRSKNKKFWREKFKNISYLDENYETLDEENIKIILAI